MFNTTQTKKPVSIQFSEKKVTDGEVYGKCKTLFMVEAYRQYLMSDEELTDETLDKMEVDCERLAGRAIRDNRGTEHNEAPKKNNDWAYHIFDKQESKSTTDGATDAQKKLIKKLSAQKVTDGDERDEYLADLDDLGKREASERIKELISI